MVNWILIALVIIGLIIFFKTTGVRFGKTWTVVIGALILFFIITFGYIIIQIGEVDGIDGIVGAIKVYFNWLTTLADNTATITGNVVNSSWEANLSN